ESEAKSFFFKIIENGSGHVKLPRLRAVLPVLDEEISAPIMRENFIEMVEHVFGMCESVLDRIEQISPEAKKEIQSKFAIVFDFCESRYEILN
ncbi:hypothetical protein PFISCL1PPCAC_19041, partial [Pristionchus fissidentatus]